MAIWIEVHRFSSRLLHHQVRWMCMEFSIVGRVRWSRQCIWSFRSEQVMGIWIDVYGILKPWTTPQSRPCVWNFQSADRSTNLLDVYRFLDPRVVVMTAVEVCEYFRRQRQTRLWKVFKYLGECQREESNQRANNPKQATTTSNWNRLNFKTNEPISPWRN